MTAPLITTELETLKGKLYATWTAGDFGVIARSFEKGAEEFARDLGIQTGMSVLDVACGNGNTAVPAALLGANVTGIDLAPYVIEQAKQRAAASGVEATFEVGDAEDLPYEAESFDSVVTMFGAMFAPRPDVVAGELTRVCRPGGQIAMANWTREGFIGQMFRITGKYVPPPPAMPSPILWGDEGAVQERLSDGIADLQMERRNIQFTFPFGPAETVEHFRKYYGPTQKAFDALDQEGQSDLRKELEELWTDNNSSGNGSTVVISEYLKVTATRS